MSDLGELERLVCDELERVTGIRYQTRQEYACERMCDAYQRHKADEADRHARQDYEFWKDAWKRECVAASRPANE